MNTKKSVSISIISGVKYQSSGINLTNHSKLN